MEQHEIEKRLIYKVFGKREIDFKESRFFRTNYTITPKGDEKHNFINIECLSPDRFEGVPHFQFRVRLFNPDTFLWMGEYSSHPLNEKDAVTYLKHIKPLLLK